MKKIIKVKPGYSFASYLRVHEACHHSRSWVGRKSLRTAWKTCDRADWLLWLADRLGIDRRVQVRAVCKCIRALIRNVPKIDPYARRALAALEGWTAVEEESAAASAFLFEYQRQLDNVPADSAFYEVLDRAYSTPKYAVWYLARSVYDIQAAVDIKEAERILADTVRNHINVSLVEEAFWAKWRGL